MIRQEEKICLCRIQALEVSQCVIALCGAPISHHRQAVERYCLALNRDAFHDVSRHLAVSAVVQPCGPKVGVAE